MRQASQLPEGTQLVYFKLVAVGPNTLKTAEHDGAVIDAIVEGQPGFYILSENGEGLKEAMDDLVIRFLKAKE